MSLRTIKYICAFIGIGLLGTFVIGLAWSISSGFAGFWGGLPFWIIVVSVLAMIVYDFWDDLRKKSPEDDD